MNNKSKCIHIYNTLKIKEETIMKYNKQNIIFEINLIMEAE